MKNNFILFSIIGLSILIGYFLGNENEFHYGEIGGDEKINRVERLLNYIENDYVERINTCLLYTSPSPRDRSLSRMPSSA